MRVAWELQDMTSPKTPEQLAGAIESLVASYIDEVRRSAQEAVDRSLSRAPTKTRPARRGPGGDAEMGHPARRRSAEELGELCEALYESVCARPGEAMSVFADEAGLPVRALRRPMSKLKREGRVRSVGERNMTRYFPAVGRRSRSSDF